MEQNGIKWTSSLLKGLGATSVAVPATNPSSKIKQFAAALSLAAMAAMANFAPSVAHAADAPAAAPTELAVTYVQPDGVQPDVGDMDKAALDKSAREAENPYTEKYTIAERERDYIDIMNDSFQNAQRKVDQNADIAKDIPLFDNPVYKAYDVVTSPLDALVKYTTDEGSTANEYAQTAADVTNMAVKYSTVGIAALVKDGIKGVQSGVEKIAEMREKEHSEAQAAVDAARERMARIYNEEREMMAAGDRAASAPVTASRIDLKKVGGGGLETSNDDLNVIYKSEQTKASKYANDHGLSR